MAKVRGDWCYCAAVGTDTTLQLSRHLTVDHCEWRLRTFVTRDAYVPYDWAGAPDDPATSVITQRQLGAVNGAMRARMPIAPWGPYLDAPRSELRMIPPALDLIDSDDEAVSDAINVLVLFTLRLTEAKGLRDMGVSKVLHLMRPCFVPVSDMWVRALLGVPEGLRPHESMREVCERVRTLYLANRAALDELYEYANALPPVVGTGKFRGQTIPVRLSKVRLLDILLWTSAATHPLPGGSFVNLAWGEWYVSEFGAPALSGE